MRLRTILPVLATCAMTGAASAQGTPIDLSTWSVIQYEFNQQPDANWVLQAGNTSVLQTINSDSSIFLSDFDAVGQEINGTWRCETTNDDDFMGFVFGYQGRGQYYLFDWKKATQTTAEVGMSLKVVATPAGVDPIETDLWPTAGSANVTTVLHNTIPWATNVTYEFTLLYSAGSIEITVEQAGNVLEHWMLADSTYTSGNFGFYNLSQDTVRYSGFTQVDVVTAYCTAKTNSQGCLPVLTTTGIASVSDATPCNVSAGQLVNRMNGVLYLSQIGPAATPFLGGTLCLAPPLIGTPLGHTGGNTGGFDCSGSLSVDVNAFLQNGGVPGLQAGDSLFAQYIVRDEPQLDGTGTSLTAAVELIVQP